MIFFPNTYALQQVLSDSTMGMVKRYIEISQSDLDDGHRHDSQVVKWGCIGYKIN
jgi:hypothetical protein